MVTLFVQSLAGLSQDPSMRTNELLQNLTEIIISISDHNASSLTVSQPQPFSPQASDIRLNLYWSTSLVISVSHILQLYWITDYSPLS